MVNSITINNHSVIRKVISKIFYLIKYYFNFKFNHFKCLHINTHSRSNTFKMINSFYPMRMSKIVTIIINKFEMYKMTTVTVKKDFYFIILYCNMKQYMILVHIKDLDIVI